MFNKIRSIPFFVVRSAMSAVREGAKQIAALGVAILDRGDRHEGENNKRTVDVTMRPQPDPQPDPVVVMIPPPPPSPTGHVAPPECEAADDSKAKFAAMLQEALRKRDEAMATTGTNRGKSNVKKPRCACGNKFDPGKAPLLPGATQCIRCTNLQLLNQEKACYWRRTADGEQMLCQNPHCNARFPLEPSKPGSSEPRLCCSSACWRDWQDLMKPVIEAFRKSGTLPQMFTVGENAAPLIVGPLTRTCRNHECARSFVVQPPLIQSSGYCLDCVNKSRMQRGQPPFFFSYAGDDDQTACQNPNHIGNRAFHAEPNEFGGLHMCCSTRCNASWKEAGKRHIEAFRKNGALPRIHVVGQLKPTTTETTKPVAKAAEPPKPASVATLDLNAPTAADIRTMLDKGTLGINYPEHYIQQDPDGSKRVLVTSPNGKMHEVAIKPESSAPKDTSAKSNGFNGMPHSANRSAKTNRASAPN